MRIAERKEATRLRPGFWDYGGASRHKGRRHKEISD